MSDNIKLMRIANKLADIAGEISTLYFRKEFDTSIKKGGSPVTKADLAIEFALREYLSKVVPSHGVLGEEYESKPTQTEYTWVIDPIDGTSSFACGKPTFCTLIALLKKDTPILGIIDQPITQERWCGAFMKQSRFNNLACFTNSGNKKSELIRLNCTTPNMFTAEQQQKFNLVKTTLSSIVSYGGDGYAYGLLASGHIDIILEADLQFYDVAALIPIIEGAGGYISDWQGNKIDMNNFNGTIVATGDKILHEKILTLIS